MPPLNISLCPCFMEFIVPLLTILGQLGAEQILCGKVLANVTRQFMMRPLFMTTLKADFTSDVLR